MPRGTPWAGSRYRGYRRSPKPIILLLLLALIIAAGAWFFLGREPSPPQPTPAAAETVQPTPTPTPEPTLPPMPQSVRGIYISGPVAGDPYMDTLLELVETTELNTVVIDVKNDEGNLTYRLSEGTAADIGACIRYIPDLPTLVSDLKARNIYTIARIAAFKDPVLAKARPDLSLRDTDGSLITEGGGVAWVNPCEPEVWSYLEEIALSAAQAGFQEVQFDYVRFPTGKAMNKADYGPALADRTRGQVIADFLTEITASLHSAGVRVSADVFGTVITNSTDAALIGQDYLALAQIVDAVCPMVYPSHYAAGAFGLDLPDRQPYETIYAALTRSTQTLEGTSAAVRPWLQDFTATWVRNHLTYGPQELRAQIQATYDAGCTGWLLWNAKNHYTAEGLEPAIDNN